MSARQLVGCLRLSIGEGLASFDVLDSADRQALDVHPVQRILTVGAATIIITGLVEFETVAAIGLAACLAVAVKFLFHNRTP
jgi:hypothetical protein